MKINNPATGNLICEIDPDSKDTLDNKFLKLQAGFKSWRATTLEHRLSLIEKFGHRIKDDRNRLADILTSETGKPIQQSRNEINGAHNRIDHLVSHAEKWLSPEVLYSDESIQESVTFEPLGVIGNISAWNFPYNVGYNVFLYALVSGNCVFYKPSEYAILTGLEIESHWHKAGVPENVFQTAIGGSEAGSHLLSLDLDGYFFTGSYQTGQFIAERVAKKLVPLQLELGGKDPLYVMDDVEDIRQAASNAAEGCFYNAGQSCCAVERIYVAEDIYDKFIQNFTEIVAAYKIGDPTNEETFIGPLTRSDQISVLEEQIRDAEDKGAQVLTGGNKREGPGHYYEPTVLIGVDHTMKVMTEETFGPLIGIQKVTSDEEALSLMQDTSYGLTAAVFGTDKSRVISILDRLNVGTVYWNCCDRVSPNVPWSGRKNSGLGSTLSYQGIRAFVHPKAYHLKR